MIRSLWATCQRALLRVFEVCLALDTRTEVVRRMPFLLDLTEGLSQVISEPLAVFPHGVLHRDSNRPIGCDVHQESVGLMLTMLL